MTTRKSVVRELRALLNSPEVDAVIVTAVGAHRLWNLVARFVEGVAADPDCTHPPATILALRVAGSDEYPGIAWCAECGAVTMMPSQNALMMGVAYDGDGS